MPTVANIVLANGEATPVNHTFVPMGRDADGGFLFEDQSPRVASTSPLGWPRIRVTTQRVTEVGPRANAAGLINRVTVTISLPQLETLGTSDTGLTPPPTVAYIDRVKTEFMLPARDTVADRKDALAYAKNVLGNANIISLVHDLQQFYG